MSGGAGFDYVDGGPGLDTLDFSQDGGWEIRVYLDGSMGGYDGFSGYDDWLNFENVVGTDHNDEIGGDAGANDLRGGAGNDKISGGDGNDTLSPGTGADTLDGGAGFDTLDLGDEYPISGYWDLADEWFWAYASGTTGPVWYRAEAATNFENAIASSFGSEIYGTAGINVLEGRAMDDRLFGRDGDDVISGGGGIDRLSGDAATTRSTGAPETTVLMAGLGTTRCAAVRTTMLLWDHGGRTI